MTTKFLYQVVISDSENIWVRERIESPASRSSGQGDGGAQAPEAVAWYFIMLKVHQTQLFRCNWSKLRPRIFCVFLIPYIVLISLDLKLHLDLTEMTELQYTPSVLIGVEELGCQIWAKGLRGNYQHCVGEEAVFCKGSCQGWLHKKCHCAGLTHPAFDRLGEPDT